MGLLFIISTLFCLSLSLSLSLVDRYSCLPTYPAPTTQTFRTGLESGVPSGSTLDRPRTGILSDCDKENEILSSAFAGPKNGLDAGVVGLVDPEPSPALQQLSSEVEVPKGEAMKSIASSAAITILLVVGILELCPCYGLLLRTRNRRVYTDPRCSRHPSVGRQTTPCDPIPTINNQRLFHIQRPYYPRNRMVLRHAGPVGDCQWSSADTRLAAHVRPWRDLLPPERLMWHCWVWDAMRVFDSWLGLRKGELHARGLYTRGVA